MIDTKRLFGLLLWSLKNAGVVVFRLGLELRGEVVTDGLAAHAL
jgi:hypothetical protein